MSTLKSMFGHVAPLKEMKQNWLNKGDKREAKCDSSASLINSVYSLVGTSIIMKDLVVGNMHILTKDNGTALILLRFHMRQWINQLKTLLYLLSPDWQLIIYSPFCGIIR